MTEKGVIVEELPRRVAHATHALIEAARRIPATAAEVCVYDEEAGSVQETAAALRQAKRLGLAGYAGGVWFPSAAALELRYDLEDRFLRETPESLGC